MRLRSRRRNLVVWSQSAGSVGRYGAPPFTRRRRIRRWIGTGALLTVVGLMPLARAVRARWRPLLAGGVLTVVGLMWLDGLGGMVLLPGLCLLLSAPLIPAGSRAGSHTDERPFGTPDLHGQPTAARPRSRTDLNGSGRPPRYLRITR
jgi:hypothetical protein